MHVRLGEQGPTRFSLKLNSNIIISSFSVYNIVTNGCDLSYKSTIFALYAQKVEILNKNCHTLKYAST